MTPGTTAAQYDASPPGRGDEEQNAGQAKVPADGQQTPAEGKEVPRHVHKGPRERQVG